MRQDCFSQRIVSRGWPTLLGRRCHPHNEHEFIPGHHADKSTGANREYLSMLNTTMRTHFVDAPIFQPVPVGSPVPSQSKRVTIRRLAFYFRVGSHVVPEPIVGMSSDLRVQQQEAETAGVRRPARGNSNKI